MNDDIIIQQGFSEELRKSAAELYDIAFGDKLSIAMPKTITRIKILKNSFNSEFCFIAKKNGKIIGIAGFKTAQGSLTGGISFKMLKKEMGYLGAIRAIIILALFSREQTSAQLLMDGISVSPDERGSGIGTKLLHRLIEYAKKEKYHSIRLDVINTNPSARRLYERIGFVPIKTERFFYLKWLLGFGAATQMEYRISLNEIII